MKSKKSGLSLGRKMSIVISVMILIGTIAVGVLGYVIYRSDSIQLGGERALAIAQSVAAGIDGDAFAATLESGEPGPDYAREKKLADQATISTGASYLYILSAQYGTDVSYYIEGYDPASGLEELGLGDTEPVDVFAGEMFETLSTGQPTYTDLYDSGEFGMQVSGFVAIKDSAGRVVGVVGTDISMDDIMHEVNSFGTKSLFIVLGASLLFGLLSIWIVDRFIGKPIKQLTAASDQIAQGDLNVQLQVESKDEIGQLAESFHAMASRTKSQVEVLEQIANGDLTVEVQARSDKDTMSFAMQKMVQALGGMFGEIRRSSEQLTLASSQISDGSQAVAQGATEQSASVEELMASIIDVAEKAQQNVNVAGKTTQLVETIKTGAQKGSGQMQDMLQAVQEIDKASSEISSVMKQIDDIAFQTNILALNAAVEAARAGQHGKGFAVVADEVRNLASKSAAAAKETGVLIENSLEKAALGVDIAGATSASFTEIVDGINESGQLIGDISKASGEQSDALAEIQTGIDQVSSVVQQNSATAEESAAASIELNRQSEQLIALVSQYKLQDGAGDYLRLNS